jgi:hypothetical protein
LYLKEEIVMSYTWEDFGRDYAKEHIHLFSPEERLNGLTVEAPLKGLPVEERLRGLPVEEIKKYLSEHTQ